MLTFNRLRAEEIVSHRANASLQPDCFSYHALLVLEHQKPWQVWMIAAYLYKIMAFTAPYINHKHSVVGFVGVRDKPLIEGIEFRVAQ